MNYFCIPGIIRSTINQKVEEIIHKTCFFFDVKKEDLMSRKRHKDIVAARHISIYLIIKKTGMTRKNASISVTGDAEHTKACYAVKSINNHLKSNDSMVANAIYEIERKLGYADR